MMREIYKWVFWVLAILSVMTCSGCRLDRSKTALESIVESQATIRCRLPCDWGTGWLAFGTGMKVATGDRIHVVRQGFNVVKLRDSRSLVILGPGTQVVLEKVSTDLGITQTRIRLESGEMYASIDESMGEGYLEVKTPGGTASLDEAAGGSAMMIAYIEV